MDKKTTKVIAAIAIIAIIAIAAAMIWNGNRSSDEVNYSDSSNWMFAQTDAVHEVDLFYIYPTVMTTSDRDDGCCNITDEMKALAIDSYKENATPFSEYTNVFSPYYRQVCVEKALELKSHDVYYDYVKASVGKQDVFAALDYYFEHYNNGRPFMLASHSQGSCLSLIVLEEYMAAHPDIYKRMVASYAIGFGVTQDYLDRNTHVKFAEGATDTGVLISWNTEGLPNEGGYLESISLGENCQVINPLTWSRSTEYASTSLNRGEYKLLDDGSITTVAGKNDAQINAERGSLICTTCTNFTPTTLMGDVALHAYDYRLYYRDIQINGFDRITAYLGHRPMTGVAMDYSDDANWVLKDYTTGSGEQSVDVFFLYATGGTSDTLVSEVNDVMKYVANYSVKTCVSAMSDYTNIFAPYYRQISSYGVDQNLRADQFEDACAREVTRTDVYAALDYYFEHYNNGKPFILAGHSQGSANLKLVISEYMKMEGHQAYMDRMVAAYLVGYEITETWIAENNLTFASSATDTGVIISWNTFSDAKTAGDGGKCTGEGRLAINPLSWSRDTAKVDKMQNEGSLRIDLVTMEETMYSHVASAQLSTVGGMLIASVDSGTGFATIDSSMFGKDSYHDNDWALFHDSIKQNGKDRINAYFDKESAE